MKDIAKTKIKLLTFGARIASIYDKGRVAGAGPAGGGYFEFENGSIVNVPLQGPLVEKSSLRFQNTDKNEWLLLDDEKPITTMHRIPPPKFYEKKTSKGIPMRKIALLHGKECLATTVIQKCIYWHSGLQCKFCGIELSLEMNHAESQKSPEMLVEVLRAGIEERVVSHVTLTSGSLAKREMEVETYCRILKAMKKEANVPLHVQIEPINIEQLERLKSAGADTIGIHLENYDPLVLESTCPGKFLSASVQDYYTSWKNAIKVFGENQVSTFILMGLGERQHLLKEGIKKTAEIGVIPFLLPVRILTGTLLKQFQSINFKTNLENFTFLAQALIESGVNPLKNKAGCIRCGACSAVNEAYKDF
ncbi:MAG: radical SAM protein [Candidatus Helarchaeota archaeon]